MLVGGVPSITPERAVSGAVAHPPDAMRARSAHRWPCSFSYVPLRPSLPIVITKVFAEDKNGGASRTTPTSVAITAKR